MNADARQAVADLLGSLAVEDGEWSETGAKDVFARLANEGWTRVGLPEELGGADGDFEDAAAVAAACAASAHQLPLADLVIVTGRTLELAGLSLPADAECALTLGTAARLDSTGLHVEVAPVPWGRWASHFVVAAAESEGTSVHLVDAAHATIGTGANLAGEPRDEVVLSGAPSLASVHVDRPIDDVIGQIRLAGALARSIQIAAASEAALQMCVTYCSDRRQFGRRLTEFQAVQQELAALKGEATAAAAAVDLAIGAVVLDRTSLPRAPIATAKARAGMAAGVAARSAHQLHGAIGITLEYPLHHHTTKLWSWRDECGDEFDWAATLLDDVTSDESASPWDRLTAV